MLDNGCSCIGRTRIFLIGTAIHIPGNINLHFLLIFLGKHAVHLFCVKVQGACQHIVLLAFNGGILTCFLFLCVQLGETIFFSFASYSLDNILALQVDHPPARGDLNFALVVVGSRLLVRVVMEFFSRIMDGDLDSSIDCRCVGVMLFLSIVWLCALGRGQKFVSSLFSLCSLIKHLSSRVNCNITCYIWC